MEADFDVVDWDRFFAEGNVGGRQSVMRRRVQSVEKTQDEPSSARSLMNMGGLSA